MKNEFYWRVKAVKPQDNYILYLTFADGKQALFDMKPYLDCGVFKSLKDRQVFDSVRVCASSIAWENNVDIAPETLYEEAISI
ncbi:hypothetical protein FACS189413_03480 [Bacteroidia bacterium]|nr:hypothetical protein FACS189413_03480 [Bacteroidia bacterium]